MYFRNQRDWLVWLQKRWPLFDIYSHFDSVWLIVLCFLLAFIFVTVVDKIVIIDNVAYLASYISHGAVYHGTGHGSWHFSYKCNKVSFLWNCIFISLMNQTDNFCHLHICTYTFSLGHPLSKPVLLPSLHDLLVSHYILRFIR